MIQTKLYNQFMKQKNLRKNNFRFVLQIKNSKNLSQKQNNILMFLCVICGILGIILLQNITLKNDLLITQCNMSEYLNYFYLNNHPKFDYINGLYLLPFGVLTICVLVLLEMDKIILKIKKKY